MRSTVPKDQPVGPVHIVLVELNGLVVLLLRVREQRPVDILAGGHPENQLRADSFVYVQCDRITREPSGLLLAGPLQSPHMNAQRFGQRPRFRLAQLLPRRLGEQLWQFIGPSSGIEPQRRREPRAVTVLGLRKHGNVPFGRDLGRGIVLPAGLRVAIIADVFQTISSRRTLGLPQTGGCKIRCSHCTPRFLSPFPSTPAPCAVLSSPQSSIKADYETNPICSARSEARPALLPTPLPSPPRRPARARGCPRPPASRPAPSAHGGGLRPCSSACPRPVPTAARRDPLPHQQALLCRRRLSRATLLVKTRSRAKKEVQGG